MMQVSSIEVDTVSFIDRLLSSFFFLSFRTLHFGALFMTSSEIFVRGIGFCISRLTTNKMNSFAIETCDARIKSFGCKREMDRCR